ncbi:conserved hypothetical protein [Ricinus communis]|uniref:Uncharacterized protein n=1 Tax=Ricinus communis TaxID=3988 RepID=B9STG9_RICCO|nr:conserved hypothetical protein [Ricinus communis]
METGPKNSPGLAIFIFEPKTVRDACWGQNMPSNHSLDHLLENRRKRINFFSSIYTWRVSIFILQGYRT